MRAILNSLSDPSLHLLAVGLILAVLAFSFGSSSSMPVASSPLSYCDQCHVHFLPEKTCNCPVIQRIAHVRP